MHQIFLVYFKRNRRNPPLFRNCPPLSGAAYWCRIVFNELKQKVLVFQDVEELKSVSEETFDQYLLVGKTMRRFEVSKYEQFLVEAEHVIEDSLAMRCLRVDYDPNAKSK